MSFPQHEKLAKVETEHQTVSEFMEFLETRVNFDSRTPESLIAEFFHIDPRAFDAETKAMTNG